MPCTILADMMNKGNTPRSCYNFNFIGGGWNQIYATSKDEAIKLAIEKYADSDNCNPDPETFRLGKPRRTCGCTS